MREFILTVMFIGFLCEALRQHWILSTLVLVTCTGIAVLSGGDWLYALCLSAVVVLAVASLKSLRTVSHIQNS